MRKYETVMVLHPELPEAQIRETIDRVKKLIETNGGQEIQTTEWGFRSLAYPIRKVQRGFYVLVEFRSKGEVVTELDRTMKIMDEVLRFLTAVAPLVQPKPRPTLEATEEKELEADFSDEVEQL